jgi:hypothetical protein
MRLSGRLLVKLQKNISGKYSNVRVLLDGDKRGISNSASPFRDSQIEQQNKPTSSTEEPSSSSRTVKKYSLER